MTETVDLITVWATRKSEGGIYGAFPELVVAWDYFSHDTNPEGFSEERDAALSRWGNDVHDVREIHIAVPRDAIEKAFMPAQIKASA